MNCFTRHWNIIRTRLSPFCHAGRVFLLGSTSLAEISNNSVSWALPKLFSWTRAQCAQNLPVNHLISWHCTLRHNRATININTSSRFIDPFRTAVPFWVQSTWNLTGLYPKRDCGSKNIKLHGISGRFIFVLTFINQVSWVTGAVP